jgi:hypothetical protein
MNIEQKWTVRNFKKKVYEIAYAYTELILSIYLSANSNPKHI